MNTTASTEAETKETEPTTIYELESWLAQRCHCMEGPAMAYFELPCDNTIGEDNGIQILRVTYDVVGVELLGEVDDAELVIALHKKLSDAINGSMWHSRDDKPLLFWRRHTDIERGKRLDTDDLMSRISCRIAIPGVNLRAPSGVNLNYVPKLIA